MNAKQRLLRRMTLAAGLGAALGMTSLTDPLSALAQKPSAADALKLVPVQNDVRFDRPEKDDTANCTVDVETIGGVSGWVVRSGSGQILRRFLDTNGDNKVDQWCYYKDGIEVYRDLDGDHNGKADQYRWLGTAGIRWGIDKNEDGRIDQWKAISAEEVTAEVVAAVREADSARFKRLLLTKEELADLGLSAKQIDDLEQKIAAASQAFADAARKQNTITKETEWVNFGASQPGVVPAGTDGSSKDVIVYDNVAAVVETDGKHSQLIVGSLVKVGETWRLIDLPRNLSVGGTPENAVLGYFLQASLSSRRPETALANEPMGVSPEMQKLITELEKIDKDLVRARSAREQTKLNEERADVLTQLIKTSKTPEDRNLWIRQFAETVSAATQSGILPDGVDRLESLLKYASGIPDAADLVPFIKFREMTAGYNLSLQDKDADYEQINKNWMASLEDFVSKYSDRPDAADAMLQLAIAYEFTGKEEDAIQWFGKIVADFPSSEIAKKAAGAKRRLESVGKPISLKGNTVDGRPVDLANLNGKVALIHYWATWCEPCKQDLLLIKELQAKYGSRGFAPIGVNLDSDAQDLTGYLKTRSLPWPQVYEEGGLESRLANEMGILTLPTMILVDKTGKVVNRNIHASELDNEIRKLLTRD
jgi:thiol-disulfide isomerase/thioredoxin